MILLSMALLPWYPSGLTYFVYGCVMLRSCRVGLRAYLLWLLGLTCMLLLETWLLRYPWQAVFSIPLTSFIIGIIVNAERANEEKDAAAASFARRGSAAWPLPPSASASAVTCTTCSATPYP